MVNFLYSFYMQLIYIRLGLYHCTCWVIISYKISLNFQKKTLMNGNPRGILLYLQKFVSGCAISSYIVPSVIPQVGSGEGRVYPNLTPTSIKQVSAMWWSFLHLVNICLRPTFLYQQLLSSSMDKTVRLWELSSKTCLKIFSHSDYGMCT